MHARACRQRNSGSVFLCMRVCEHVYIYVCVCACARVQWRALFTTLSYSILYPTAHFLTPANRLFAAIYCRSSILAQTQENKSFKNEKKRKQHPKKALRTASVSVQDCHRARMNCRHRRRRKQLVGLWPTCAMSRLTKIRRPLPPVPAGWLCGDKHFVSAPDTKE